MDTGKEIIYILKNLVKELHELNRTLGRISRASIFEPPYKLHMNVNPEPLETSTDEIPNSQ